MFDKTLILGVFLLMGSYSVAQTNEEMTIIECEGTYSRVSGSIEKAMPMAALVMNNRGELIGRKSLGLPSDQKPSRTKSEIFEMSAYVTKEADGKKSIFIDGTLTDEGPSRILGLSLNKKTVNILGNASLKASNLKKIEFTVSNSGVLSKIHSHRNYDKAILLSQYTQHVQAMIVEGELAGSEVSSVTMTCDID